MEIHTKRNPSLTGVSSHGTILLHDVLHVPGVKCNAIGAPILDVGYTVEMNPSHAKHRGLMKDSNGKSQAYFDPKKPLFILKLRSPPNGLQLAPPKIIKGELCWIQFRWEPTEKQRWLKFKATHNTSSTESNVADCGGATGAEASLSTEHQSDTVKTEVPGYTSAEKAYIKKHWANEFNFLHTLGLSIYKGEDREEGRSILRALMHNDSSDDSHEEQAATANTSRIAATNQVNEAEAAAIVNGSMSAEQAAENPPGMVLSFSQLGQKMVLKPRSGH